MRVVASASAEAMPKSIVRMLRDLIGSERQIGLSERTVQFLIGEAPSAFIGLFRADLAAAPLSAVMLPHEWRHHPVISLKKESRSATDASRLQILPRKFRRSARSMVKLVAKGWAFHATILEEERMRTPPEHEVELRETLLTRWTGLLFPTRPMHLGELSFVARALEPSVACDEAAFGRQGEEPTAFAEALSEQFSESALALRGYSVDGSAFGIARYRVEEGRGIYRLISVPHFDYELAEPKGHLSIALAAVRTTREQLASAIRGEPDLSLERYRSICALINNVIAGKEKAQSLVLPELSLPVEWFSRLAFKLQAAGTSLIAGIEYRRVPGPPDRVRNQVWASFVHDEWGFRSSVFYLQDKQHPAHGEELNLLGENSTRLQAQSTWRTPPVIEFRGVRIGILICSELTNLEYRTYLRGRIDVLIAPEWNRDLKTFSSIIETSAFDMHVFIVQANNRLHGDTRIRGPYRDEWRRDMVKVSGGSHDYVIAAEVDVAALRKFQTSPTEDCSEFKTLPDGFMMSQDRRSGSREETRR